MNDPRHALFPRDGRASIILFEKGLATLCFFFFSGAARTGLRDEVTSRNNTIKIKEINNNNGKEERLDQSNLGFPSTSHPCWGLSSKLVCQFASDEMGFAPLYVCRLLLLPKVLIHPMFVAPPKFIHRSSPSRHNN